MALRVRADDHSLDNDYDKDNDTRSAKENRTGLLSKSMAELIAEADSLQQRRFEEEVGRSRAASPGVPPAEKKKKASPAALAPSMSLWVEKYTPKSFSQVRDNTLWC